MNLEQFLKPDGYYFNFIHAIELIGYVCHIISILEKDKRKYNDLYPLENKRRYTDLYPFLKNKQKYFALRDELDVFIDKYNLHGSIGIQCSEGEEEISDVEEDDPYDILTYKKYLEHADKLLARDITWSKTYYSRMWTLISHLTTHFWLTLEFYMILV